MPDELLRLDSAREGYVKTATLDDPLMDTDIGFNGVNEDFTEAYFWHMTFAYYVGKGYKALKFEDYHYFSEASQFGGNYRQLKGGSIRAFQENFQQLISLIRQHLLPLLKEIKEAHFYKEWFDQITDNDEMLQKELSKKEPNKEKVSKYRGARNEAINHMKDKWINEVDGGRLWQMNRPATEQGLDFSLLPQLFVGTNLDDPLQTKRTLKEQLDDDIYSIDISIQAKEQVARFMFKFYTWLPTAIKDTEVTFKLKVSALRNIYAQTQMYINFMKPLLKEISRKNEGLNKDNFFHGFDMENPDFVNIFDTSHSFIKIVGVKGLERQGKKITDLEFTRFGLFVNEQETKFGPHKGKTGFLGAEIAKKKKYVFFESKEKDISDEEFKKIKENWEKNPTYMDKEDLRKFPIIENDFSQTRRTEVMNTQQGQQQVPYMKNKIRYRARAWNIYEIASYREQLKEDDLKLMESFISEISVVRDDLVKYLNYFSGDDVKDIKKGTEEKSHKEDKEDFDLVTGPFRGIAELIEPLLPTLNTKNRKKDVKSRADGARDKDHLQVQLNAVEDAQKCYGIFKKSHGFIHY